MPTIEEKRECLYCHAPLEGMKSEAKYCSENHRGMYRRNGPAPLPEVPQFPRDIPGVPGARENYCANHDEIYRQLRPINPTQQSALYGIDGGQHWIGHCSECLLESALMPVMQQQVQERRQEVNQRVKDEMERRKDEIAEAVEERLAPQIVIMREEIEQDIREIVEVQIRQTVNDELAQEIFQTLKAEAPRKVKMPWQQLTATPATLPRH